MWLGLCRLSKMSPGPHVVWGAFEQQARQGTMFWKAIEHLNRWERAHLPCADTPQGSEVLIWLLRSQSRPRPLKDLYRSSRYSEPTLRACLKTFVDLGFIT